MLEAFENVIIRKIMGEEIDYKPSELNKHNISVYTNLDNTLTIGCHGKETEDKVEKALKEWAWKYTKEYNPNACYPDTVIFHVQNKMPDRIKVTDTMFINEGNVIIANNVQRIHQKLDGSKFKHVTYDAPAYALCGASWTIQYEDIIIVLDHALCSGGHVSWGERDIIESGPWGLHLPDFLEPYEEELTKLANENIPQGCCGGCI